MAPPKASEDFYGTVQQFELMLLVAGRRLWRQMRPADFDGSFRRILPQLTAWTSGAQLAAAQAGVAYVPAVLEEQGVDVEPLARIRPQAFSGVASDGRLLPGLLAGAVIHAKNATRSRRYTRDDGTWYVERGLDGGDALRLGERWLEQALQTAVADAARDASQAAIAVRPQVGYVRMVNPPCCSRCAVLAGRIYKFNEGFQRHPRCDCLHIPTTLANADSFLADPSELAKRGLITDLTKGQRARLDDGADLSKVLNESRDRWRERMAADRRAAGPVDRLGRSRRQTWGPGGNAPPPGTTIHQLFGRLTSQVDAAQAMKAAGIAA